MKVINNTCSIKLCSVMKTLCYAMTRLYSIEKLLGGIKFVINLIAILIAIEFSLLHVGHFYVAYYVEGYIYLRTIKGRSHMREFIHCNLKFQTMNKN